MHWLESQSFGGQASRSDVEAIEQHLKPATLRAVHPLLEAWAQPSLRGADFLWHLADDIKAVQGVQGAASLFKVMRQDIEHFHDYRYELRIAGAVAKPADQQLVALAGPDAGPDIRFTARSGHVCGVACYRANSATPRIARLRAVAHEVARSSLRRFTFSPLSELYAIELIFPSNRVSEAQQLAAVQLAARLLTEPFATPELAQCEVKVRRVAVSPDLLLPGDLRRVRLRFLFPVRTDERVRVLGHLRPKIAKEMTSWANTFAGSPLLAIEESDGSQDGLVRPELNEIINGDGSPFWGAFLTWYPRSGPESVEWIPREKTSQGLHVEVMTFRDNMTTWAAGAPTMRFVMEYATEDWDLVQTVAGCSAELVEPLHTGTHVARLPRPQNPRNPNADPAFRRSLEEATAHVRAEAASFRPARTVIGRRPA